MDIRFQAMIGAFVLIIFTSIEVVAQLQNNAFYDYERVITTVSQLKETTIEMRYSMYDSFTAKLPEESLGITIWRNDDLVYMKSSHLESILTEEQYVLIDHEAKYIQIQLTSIENLIEVLPTAEDVRQWVEHLGLYPLRFRSENGEVGITFCAPGLSGSEISILYDPTTLLPSSIRYKLDLDQNPHTMHPLDKKRVEVEYRKYDLQQQEPPLKVRDIYKVRKGKPIGIENFKDYQIEVLNAES